MNAASRYANCFSLDDILVEDPGAIRFIPSVINFYLSDVNVTSGSFVFAALSFNGTNLVAPATPNNVVATPIVGLNSLAFDNEVAFPIGEGLQICVGLGNLADDTTLGVSTEMNTDLGVNSREDSDTCTGFLGWHLQI